MIQLLLAAALLSTPSVAVAAPITGGQYVAKAGASDQYEIQSSKLVLATSTNAKLRAFATQMVKDHDQSTADVKAAATAGHVKVGPPHLDAMGAANIAKLKAARGPARDTLYIAQQKKSHQMALVVQQGYADKGSVPPLKAAAIKIVPVVQHHITELAAM
ncbi:DUF4142 domain-containing protein [Sphingomonas bacterium]|uniref:DUF4142 domain-containing protein n=1 Tax=Sphingomonas bacterium TaxID=1895847 RepID=UPI001574EEDE|nr:DUF4142 domain-containing protein [Sphingomonas bacterium]